MHMSTIPVPVHAVDRQVTEKQSFKADNLRKLKTLGRSKDEVTDSEGTDEDDEEVGETPENDEVIHRRDGKFW